MEGIADELADKVGPLPKTRLGNESDLHKKVDFALNREQKKSRL